MAVSTSHICSANLQALQQRPRHSRARGAYIASSAEGCARQAEKSYSARLLNRHCQQPVPESIAGSPRRTRRPSYFNLPRYSGRRATSSVFLAKPEHNTDNRCGKVYRNLVLVYLVRRGWTKICSFRCDLQDQALSFMFRQLCRKLKGVRYQMRSDSSRIAASSGTR